MAIITASSSSITNIRTPLKEISAATAGGTAAGAAPTGRKLCGNLMRTRCSGLATLPALLLGPCLGQAVGNGQTQPQTFAAVTIGIAQLMKFPEWLAVAKKFGLGCVDARGLALGGLGIEQKLGVFKSQIISAPHRQTGQLALRYRLPKIHHRRISKNITT